MSLFHCQLHIQIISFTTKTSNNHPLKIRMCLLEGLDLTQSNRSCLLQRITIHTRTDQRKSDGFQTVLHGQGKTIPVTCRQQLRFPLSPVRINRSYRVNHVTSFQIIPFCNFRLPGPASVQRPALRQQLFASSPVNCSVNSSTSQQGSIRRIHDCIHVQRGNIRLNDFQSIHVSYNLSGIRSCKRFKSNPLKCSSGFSIPFNCK